MKNEAKIQMRMPGDLRDWFKEYSQQRNRSMNGQLIEMLREKQAAETEKAPNA